MATNLQFNSFLIVVGRNSGSTLPGVGSAYSDSFVHLWVDSAQECHLVCRATADGFAVRAGEFVAGGRHDAILVQDYSGVTLSYDAVAGQLQILCDRLGTVPLYIKHNAGGCLKISNRIENLLDGTVEPDWQSIQQYLHTGFTVGSTTLFKGILQTEGNQEICIQATEIPNMTIRQRSHQAEFSAMSSIDLLDAIALRLSEVLARSNNAVLMMSAGWDSRTLLALGAAYIKGAYTHGDLSSREIEIARRLSGHMRIDHLFTDVMSIDFSVELIDEMLQQVGFSVFPIWYVASQVIQRWKSAPIMSGVLGELLGGHYGLMSIGTRWQKFLSSFLVVSDSLIDEATIRRFVEAYCRPPQTHWFVSTQGQQILDAERGNTKDRIQSEIERYCKMHGGWQRGLEEFNMAHRARQYIMKQAQASTSTVGYCAPFADGKLTDLTRQLDFRFRVHNKANQAILKKVNPDLLECSMAATLVPAKYPIIMQELSRVVRILIEKSGALLGREKPRLGWFNYENIYEKNVLHDLAGSLQHEFWSAKKMHLAIEANRKNGVDAGSTLDMVCKLKFVDRLLTYT